MSEKGEEMTRKEKKKMIKDIFDRHHKIYDRLAEI